MFDEISENRTNGHPPEPAPSAYSGPSLFPDLDVQIRKTISEVTHHHPKGRGVIAEEMSRLTGISISESMLNDYCAESKRQVRFPAAFVAAFCLVTGDRRLQTLLLDPSLLRLLELGESFVRARAATAQRDELADVIIRKENARG